MSDVFILYHSDDEALSAAIAWGLVKENYSVRTNKNLQPGTSYRRFLQRSIARAGAVIVVWGNEEHASSSLIGDAEQALRSGKYIGVSLRDSAWLPEAFRSLPTFELKAENLDGFFPNLFARLDNLGVQSSLDSPTATIEQQEEQVAKGFAFISHVEEDASVVAKISTFLKTRGYAYWTYHESDRDYQKPTILEIEERMLDSALLLTVISPDWKRSDWTQRELAFAREIKKPMFHLRFGNPGPTLAIAGDTYFDFERGEDDAFRKLGTELDKKGL